MVRNIIFIDALVQGGSAKQYGELLAPDQYVSILGEIRRIVDDISLVARVGPEVSEAHKLCGSGIGGEVHTKIRTAGSAEIFQVDVTLALEFIQLGGTTHCVTRGSAEGTLGDQGCRCRIEVGAHRPWFWGHFICFRFTACKQGDQQCKEN